MSRISNGWQLAKNALSVLGVNKQLLIFPVLSGLTILVVIASFFAGINYSVGFGDFTSRTEIYSVVFLFYMVAYFIVVFFNMALIHCATLYFKGEDASVSQGLAFSWSRVGLIVAWAAFAATVGTTLKIIQDNLGTVGKIIAGLLGFVWSAATFFVVPVIAYEKTGPLQSIKRSTLLMKEKWGESVVANFSFGALALFAIILLGIVSIGISELINESLGIAIAVAGFGLIAIVVSAIKSIIIGAAYHNIDSDIDLHFNRQLLDGLFKEK